MNFPEVFVIPELAENVLGGADYDAILNYCRSFKQSAYICRSATFWENKARRDFNISLDVFRNTDLSPIQRYLQILTENGGVGEGSEKIIDWDEFVKRAIRQNKTDIVNYAIKQGYKNWDLMLQQYSKKGDRGTVNSLLRLSPNFQAIAEGAILGGHMDIYRDLAKVAPPNYKWNYTKLAEAAVEAGNKELFDASVPLTALDKPYRWNSFAIAALKSGNIPFFDYIVTLAPSNVWNWSLVTAGFIKEASELDVTQIIKILNHLQNIARQKNYAIEPSELAFSILESSPKFGTKRSIELLNYVFGLQPPPNEGVFYESARTIASLGNKELFNYVLNLIPTYIYRNWNDFARSALNGGHKEMFDYIRSLARLNFIWNWERLIESVPYNSPELKQYVINLSQQ